MQNVDGDRAREEMKLSLPAGGFRSEALLLYGDAIAAGRRGRPQRGRNALRRRAGQDAQVPRVGFDAAPGRAAGRGMRPRGRLGATGGLVVRRRGPLPRHRTGAGRAGVPVAAASGGRPVPRREHGHRDVPAALAALGITDREADVLALLADGLTSREIGSRLFISARTVDKHVERLLAKTGRSRRAELQTFTT